MILEYNTVNHLDFVLDVSNEDINQRISNNGVEEMSSTDINNNKEDIKLVDIDEH